MTRDRVAQLLHEAVYRVIRRAPPLPTVERFLELPLRGLLPGSSPRAWPGFWKEALTESIAAVFHDEGYQVDELDARIFLRWNRKMRSIRDWIAERVMPLPPAREQATADETGEAGNGALSAKTAARPGSPARRPASTGASSVPVLILAVLLGGFSILAAPAGARGATSLAGSRAVFERTPLTRAESASFDYDIRLAFKTPSGRAVDVPVDAVCDPTRYDLRSDCAPAEPVPVDRIVWRGAGRREGHATGAILYGDFDPACAYALTIAFPGCEALHLDAVPCAGDSVRLETGFVRFVRFVDQHVSGSLDLRTLEDEEDRVGVDLQAQVDFPVLRGRFLADAIDCQIVADGMLAVDRQAERAHNALAVDLSLTWLKRYVLRPGWLGRHAHVVGFQLAPLGIEGDQNLKEIDYTVGPAVTFSLPFLDPPLLAWHRLIEMPRGFLPPTARIGYTWLHRVRPDAQRPPDRSRLDLELVALAPLLRPLDLEARYRVYHDLDEGKTEDLLELSWKWYVADDTRTAVLLKLVHGALPPAFREADLIGVGFALGL